MLKCQQFDSGKSTQIKHKRILLGIKEKTNPEVVLGTPREGLDDFNRAESESKSESTFPPQGHKVLEQIVSARDQLVGRESPADRMIVFAAHGSYWRGMGEVFANKTEADIASRVPGGGNNPELAEKISQLRASFSRGMEAMWLEAANREASQTANPDWFMMIARGEIREPAGASGEVTLYRTYVEGRYAQDYLAGFPDEHDNLTPKGRWRDFLLPIEEDGDPSLPIDGIGRELNEQAEAYEGVVDEIRQDQNQNPRQGEEWRGIGLFKGQLLLMAETCREASLVYDSASKTPVDRLAQRLLRRMSDFNSRGR